MRGKRGCTIPGPCGARGVALLNALLVAALLVVFTARVSSFLLVDYHAARTRQDAVQAYWNARSGMERYLATGTLPQPEPGSGLRRFFLSGNDGTQQCLVSQEKATSTLIFEGVSGRVHRRIILPRADLERAYEDAP